MDGNKLGLLRKHKSHSLKRLAPSLESKNFVADSKQAKIAEQHIPTCGKVTTKIICSASTADALAKGKVKLPINILQGANQGRKIILVKRPNAIETLTNSSIDGQSLPPGSKITLISKNRNSTSGLKMNDVINALKFPEYPIFNKSTVHTTGTDVEVHVTELIQNLSPAADLDAVLLNKSTCTSSRHILGSNVQVVNLDHSLSTLPNSKVDRVYSKRDMSVQTDKNLHMSEKIVRLEERLKEKTMKGKTLQRQVTRMRNTISQLKKGQGKKTQAAMRELLNVAKENLSETAYDLFRLLLNKETNGDSRGVRYENCTKEFALSLFCCSKSAYRICQSVFLLPSLKSLQRVSKPVPLSKEPNILVEDNLDYCINAVACNLQTLLEKSKENNFSEISACEGQTTEPILLMDPPLL